MCTRSFQIKKLEKKLAIAEKELQQARKDNQALVYVCLYVICDRVCNCMSIITVCKLKICL
jgi:hypothetical protein